MLRGARSARAYARHPSWRQLLSPPQQASSLLSLGAGARRSFGSFGLQQQQRRSLAGGGGGSSSRSAGESRVKDILEKGAKLQERGKLQAAMACYEQALRRDNSDFAAHVHKATLLKDTARYAEAAQSFGTALMINQKHIPSLAAQAFCLAAAGDVEAGVRMYNQLLWTEKRYAPAFGGRAELFMALGRTDEALRDFCAALDIERDNVNGLVGAGRALMSGAGPVAARTGVPDFEGAHKYYAEAVAVSPENMQARYHFGVLQCATGEFEAGEASFAAALAAIGASRRRLQDLEDDDDGGVVLLQQQEEQQHGTDEAAPSASSSASPAVISMRQRLFPEVLEMELRSALFRSMCLLQLRRFDDAVGAADGVLAAGAMAGGPQHGGAMAAAGLDAADAEEMLTLAHLTRAEGLRYLDEFREAIVSYELYVSGIIRQTSYLTAALLPLRVHLTPMAGFSASEAAAEHQEDTPVVDMELCNQIMHCMTQRAVCELECAGGHDAAAAAVAAQGEEALQLLKMVKVELVCVAAVQNILPSGSTNPELLPTIEKLQSWIARPDVS